MRSGGVIAYDNRRRRDARSRGPEQHRLEDLFEGAVVVGSAATPQASGRRDVFVT